MSWDVRVLTAPSLDTELCLLVTFDNAKYLINCGEGTQRNFVQKKISMRKLDGVFLTNGSASCIGGLPGVMMTLADGGSGSNVLKVAGPETVPQFLASCRTFVQRESLPLSILDIPVSSDQPVYQTNQLSVRAVTLRPQDPSERRPIAADANQQEEFAWRDTSRQLKHLSNSQLRWWRRQILKGIFKDPNPTSNAAKPPMPIIADADEPKEVPFMSGKPQRQQTLSRSYIPQPIPLDGTDVQTNSQPSLLEDIRIAYIFQAPMVRGKFDNNKAKQLGVPNGPIRGKLTAGQSVEIEDPKNPGYKRVIKPEDVVGAPQDGGAAIILDIDVHHIESLIQTPALQEYQIGGDKHANLVVHRVTAAVTRDSRYVDWAGKFDDKTEQIITITDEVDDAITYTSSSWNLLRLNMLHKDIFQLPVVEKSEAERLPPVDKAQPLQAYQTVKMYPAAPLTVVAHSGADPNYPESVRGQQASREAVLTQMPMYADALRTLESAPAVASQSQPDDYGITVTPFGTGSAIPSKYRNVSSTLVDIPGFGGVLLDAGEGTLGQMRRRFGTRGMAEQIYPNLRMVLISHMHADHHLGLRLVLEDRLKHNPEQMLYIVAPSYILLHLVENGMRVGDVYGKTRFVDIIAYEEWIKRGSPEPNNKPAPAGRRPAQSQSGNAGPEQLFFQPHYGYRRELNIQAVRALQDDLGLTSFLTPEVNHRGKAYGLAMQHKSGWKIVYSGDTMPCESLIAAGRDCTLLIHEATLEDTEVEMALVKAHSTFGQAIDVGSKMNAKYLLLNHFSQRYPKLPRIQPFDPASEQKRPIIALAFDLMTLPLKSFPVMESYNEAFQALFQEMAAAEPESDEEDEVQAKPGDKKNNKKPQGKQNKQAQTVEKSGGRNEKSNRQRKRQERREGWDNERAKENDVSVDSAAPPSSEGHVVGEKRPLAEALGEDVESGQKGLKRSKSDAEEKLSAALDNLKP